MIRFSIFLIIICIFAGCARLSTTNDLPKDDKALTDQKTLAMSSLRRRNYKQALEEIEVAEQMAPKDPEVHFIRGIILFAIQDSKGAEQSYKNAIKLNPDYSKAHFNICGLYLQNKSYDEATVHCQKAADDKLYESRDRALTTLGVIQFQKGDLDSAMDYFVQSLKVNPAFVYTHNELGKLYVAQGRLTDAIEEFQIAVNGYAAYTEAHYNLGITYIKLKETYKACNSFKQVVEISPNSTLGRKSKDYVNSICSGVY